MLIKAQLSLGIEKEDNRRKHYFVGSNIINKCGKIIANGNILSIKIIFIDV